MVDPAKDAMAPAIAITALDLMFKVGSNVWAAVSDLVMYGMFAFCAYVLFVLIRWPIERSGCRFRFAGSAVVCGAWPAANVLKREPEHV